MTRQIIYNKKIYKRRFTIKEDGIYKFILLLKRGNKKASCDDRALSIFINDTEVILRKVGTVNFLSIIPLNKGDKVKVVTRKENFYKVKVSKTRYFSKKWDAKILAVYGIYVVYIRRFFSDGRCEIRIMDVSLTSDPVKNSDLQRIGQSKIVNFNELSQYEFSEYKLKRDYLSGKNIYWNQFG